MLYLSKKACRNGKLPYPHSAKEPLGGVTVRGFKGEPDEGPCGRSLGTPPFYGEVMSMTLTYTR